MIPFNSGHQNRYGPMTLLPALLGLMLTLFAAARPGAAAPSRDDSAAPMSLEALLDEALARSPLMAAAHQNVHVFEAKLREAWWAWFPSSRMDFRLGVTPAKWGDPIEGGTDFNRWGVHWRFRVEGAMPLYTFGKISALREAAREGVQVAEATVDLARAEVALLVRQSYYGWQLGRQMEDIVSDGRRYLDRARERLIRLDEEDCPDFDQTDLLRLRVYEADVETLFVQSRRIQQQALQGLALLLGRAGRDGLPATPTPVAVEKRDLEQEGPPLDLLEDLVARFAHDQPELRVAKHGARAQRALAGARFADLFPDLVLAAHFSYAQSPVADEQSSPFAYDPWNSWFGGAGLALRYELDLPRRLARSRGASAEAARTEALGDVQSAQVALEVTTAWLEAEQARELLPTYQRAHRAARAWVMAKSDLYDGGFAPLEEVTDALVEFFKRRLGYLQAIHDHNMAMARLSRALGTDLFKPEKTASAPTASRNL